MEGSLALCMNRVYYREDGKQKAVGANERRKILPLG